MQQQGISDTSSLFLLYKSLFENYPDGSYVVDIEGNFLLINKTLEELTGFTQEELLQSSFHSLISKDLRKHYEESFSEVLNGINKMIDITIINKSGTYLDLNVTAVPISIDNQVIGVACIAIDITDRKDLLISKNRLSNIVNNIDICLWSSSPSYNGYCQMSPSCLKIYGYTQADFMKTPLLWKEVIHPDDIAFVEEQQKLLVKGKSIDYQYRIIDATGDIKWLSAKTIPVFNDLGELDRLDGMTTDISKSRKAEEELYFLAYYDSLTELPNRRLFEKHLETTLSESNKSNSKVAILFLDLDHFKLFNDTLGHRVGDELLQIISKRLKSQINHCDFLARQGGDEFVVLLKDITDVEQVMLFAKKIIEIISSPIDLAGKDYVVTTSIGISLYPDLARDSEDLLKQADQATTMTKASGKNNFQFYHDDMSRSLSRKLELTQELRQALNKNALSLYYQPIVDIRAGQIVGFEALLRWKDKKLGFISPAEFIPIAEESSLIVPIGEWVLRTACTQIMEIHHLGYTQTYVSVNISTRQFEEESFVTQVKNILNETNIDPRLLKIEITESVMMKDIMNIIVKLQELGDLGIEVLLDDFGTGYSSLSYLGKLPINTLKIDQSFVQSINKSSGQEAIVRTIIGMANSLEKGIIAEGVEQEEQLHFLQDLGCTNLQGYLFSKPLPFTEIRKFLQKEIKTYHKIKI
ncbi:EAL domain-containing protein [Neobacillus sp. MM2021_6]|uniref:EAL domain-containing protein n=1 Tax=Bacillaceae TaxID=186817 RepID=UPI00140BB235|nr:EAL domain-containing protein [Neobacillus sp. MM2021_6]NHC18421.1 EAL domain-containing protein [Bacillus sp. MM2020_4]